MTKKIDNVTNMSECIYIDIDIKFIIQYKKYKNKNLTSNVDCITSMLKFLIKEL